MTPEQVKLVQQSFAKVAPIADQAATMFYGRLFEIAPAVKPLFHGDMREQRRKLMATLAAVVGGLADIESILPTASALASAMSATASRPSTTVGRRSSSVDAAARPRIRLERQCLRSLGCCLRRPVGLHGRGSLSARTRGRMSNPPEKQTGERRALSPASP